MEFYCQKSKIDFLRVDELHFRHGINEEYTDFWTRTRIGITRIFWHKLHELGEHEFHELGEHEFHELGTQIT